MEERKILVNGKEYTIKEIKYKDVVALSDTPNSDAAKKLLILSTGISEEDYEDLSMKVGMEIQKVVNEINGLEGFQQPPIK